MSHLFMLSNFVVVLHFNYSVVMWAIFNLGALQVDAVVTHRLVFVVPAVEETV